MIELARIESILIHIDYDTASMINLRSYNM